MNDAALKKAVTFRCGDDFTLSKIFECGQCFRWNRAPDGSYAGVAFGHAARIQKSGDYITISGTPDIFEHIWRGYFDLDRRYSTIRETLCIDTYMRTVTEYGAGIRILRQEPWETLCSFLLSQCNNIPRIKSIIERLCRMFGREITFDGGVTHAFPSAERLAALTAEDLAPLRCGYRAPYLIAAARTVAGGTLDLDALSRGSPEDALRALKSIDGVGDKVASCVLLFGLGMLDAFPRDVWIRRAVAEQYGKRFDPAIFGGFAGLAQQYMFYHRRETANSPKNPQSGSCASTVS